MYKIKYVENASLQSINPNVEIRCIDKYASLIRIHIPGGQVLSILVSPDHHEKPTISMSLN